MRADFLIAKIGDIGLVTVVYFLVGFSISTLFDYTLGEFNEEAYANVSTWRIIVEVCAHLFVIGILVYIVRNIGERLPSPFEGIGGFRHARLKEIGGGVVLSYSLFIFQHNLMEKIYYLESRITGPVTKLDPRHSGSVLNSND